MVLTESQGHERERLLPASDKNEILSAESNKLWNFSFGKFQKALFFKLLLATFFAEGTWSANISFLTLYCSGKYGLGSSQSGLYAVAMFGGEAIGASLFGRASDHYGRRPVILASMVLSSLSGIFCAVCPVGTTFAFLLLGLFVLGAAMGGTIPTTGIELFSNSASLVSLSIFLLANHCRLPAE